jgi:glycosyltransferase involved in cell wall biosynthesis
MDKVIFVSIASYRDPDLINTVKSCYENSSNKDSLFFSIFSQAEDLEHPDLSFIPEGQIRYLKTHWSESRGACWARATSTRNIIGDYFLQIDSHSRFIKNWDIEILNNYKNAQDFWGNKIILTNYPDPFELSEESYLLLPYETLKKIDAFWDKDLEVVGSKMPWSDVQDLENGDEVFYICAGCIFTTSDIMKQLPYDKDIYFYGEEPTLAIRAYTRGIRMISPVVKFMFTNYNLKNSKRRVHWEDNDFWGELQRTSSIRVSDIVQNKKPMGKYGIKSPLLFEQYQKIVGIPIVESPSN